MASSDQARVLIVEDDDLVRDYISLLVSSLGYEVAAAVSVAREALDLLASGKKIDVLLTDVVMSGGINGRQLADTVLRDHPGIAILMVSGNHQDPSIQETLQAKRTAFLGKPFRKRELAASLSALLED